MFWWESLGPGTHVDATLHAPPNWTMLQTKYTPECRSTPQWPPNSKELKFDQAHVVPAIHISPIHTEAHHATHSGDSKDLLPVPWCKTPQDTPRDPEPNPMVWPPWMLEWLGLREFEGTILPFSKQFLSSFCGVFGRTVRQGGPQPSGHKDVFEWVVYVKWQPVNARRQRFPAEYEQNDQRYSFHLLVFPTLKLICEYLAFLKMSKWFPRQIPTSLSIYSNTTAFICVWTNYSM